VELIAVIEEPEDERLSPAGGRRDVEKRRGVEHVRAHHRSDLFKRLDDPGLLRRASREEAFDENDKVDRSEQCAAFAVR